MFYTGLQATNFRKTFEKLIALAEAGEVDEIMITYSGHGLYLEESGRNARDEGSDFNTGRGRDEVIVPSDFRTAGNISDDYLAANLNRIPSSCRVFILMDCCFAGSNCDLQVVLRNSRQPPQPVLRAEQCAL